MNHSASQDSSGTHRGACSTKEAWVGGVGGVRGGSARVKKASKKDGASLPACRYSCVCFLLIFRNEVIEGSNLKGASQANRLGWSAAQTDPPSGLLFFFLASLLRGRVWVSFTSFKFKFNCVQECGASECSTSIFKGLFSSRAAWTFDAL